ncbi:hypothetical protein M426DRAFT_241163 [Hypoxylon sp. CI-4A]|nr:hypothetical protein M426DRAFT_241163 [Hypoxylon sp. CI-4A]
MKSTVVAAILAALPAWVSAVVLTNSNYENIQTGQPFEITWSGATGAVTLILKDGPSDNLETVGEITSGQTGESYTWTPETSLTTGTYALEINDGTDVNYSQQFDIQGADASSSSVSSSASSTSASASATSTVESTTLSTITTTSSDSSSITSTASSTSTSDSSASSTTESITSTSASASISGSITSNSTIASSTTGKYHACAYLYHHQLTRVIASSTSHTSSASATASETIAPNTNGAQAVAPFMAPLLLALGAVLM